MLVVTARPGVSGVCYSRRCGLDKIAFTSEGPLKYGCGHNTCVSPSQAGQAEL